MQSNRNVRSRDDVVFDTSVYIILAIVALLILFPVAFVFSASITPYEEVLRNGGFVLIPKAISWEAYATLIKKSTLADSFFVSAFITIIGTTLNVIFTTLMAYPLSRKDLPWRKAFLGIVVFTLMFNGGMVPTYLVVRATGLINSVWSMIIPQIIWTQHLLVLKSFMESIPEELLESARIDGAGEFRILVRIAIPLCVPSIITVAVYYGVQHWNEFQQAIFYITKPQLWPVQVIVRNNLVANENVADVGQVIPTMTLQMASVVVATMPIFVFYPFVQKFYVRGITSGAVKG